MQPYKDGKPSDIETFVKDNLDQVYSMITVSLIRRVKGKCSDEDLRNILDASALKLITCVRCVEDCGDVPPPHYGNTYKTTIN